MTNQGDITGLDTRLAVTPVTGPAVPHHDHRSRRTPPSRAAVTVVGLDATESPPMERISSVRTAAAAWGGLSGRARWVIAWSADA